MIELYHWEPNGESLSLLICLEEQGLEFRSHYVDMLQFEHHGPDYLALSPKAQVPLLLAEDEVMNDAGFAMQYLAERYAGFAPDEASGWYDLQAWTTWLGSGAGLAADVQLLGWNYVMLDAIPADELASFQARAAKLPREKVSGWAAVWSDAEADEERLKNAEERVQQVIAKMESTLTEQAWMVGGEYSIVDMMAFAQVYGLPDLLPGIVNEKTTPNIMDWLQRISSRPAVAGALSMRQTTIAPAVYLAPGC